MFHSHGHEEPTKVRSSRTLERALLSLSLKRIKNDSAGTVMTKLGVVFFPFHPVFSSPNSLTHSLPLSLLFFYLAAERKSEVSPSVTATSISARAVAEKLSRSKDLSPASSSRFSFSFFTFSLSFLLALSRQLFVEGIPARAVPGWNSRSP